MDYEEEEEKAELTAEDLQEPVIEVVEPTFPPDIIKLEHSFGYDCKRLYNMVLIDDDTLVFASGNYLHYYSISRNEVTFRETVYGAGVGFITKNEHPDYLGLLTVGENGKTPTIFIYEYPSHEIRIKLLGAAKSCFTCGSYNATGELFASQAGYPDFMLTIWRWETASIILRSKAFQNDVLHVHFSRFNPILLSSCGLSHIKFWKMANTFTGLKLQGDLGRFGKTDFSDIYAVYMLPDENVISGCEWGNLLLWEAGLIKFEICRKGRKPCHSRPITRITMENGEVMTVGMDGYVRIWFWETVDLADPPDEDRFVEIDPIYEFQVGNCEIRSLQKLKPFELTDYMYYAQDGSGGIWICDLNTGDVPSKPRKLYSCHGGKVLAAQVSPVSPHLMTLGEDGKVTVYDYRAKRMILEKSFAAVGTDLLWFNSAISKNGMELVAGFKDGVVRQLLLVLHKDRPRLRLVDARKGHVAPITKTSVNPGNTVLVTGSEDLSIFLYGITEKTEIGFVKLKPIGFVVLDAVPNAFNWLNNAPTPTVLIGCKTGEVHQYILPLHVTESDTYLSYNITGAINEERLKSTKFVSVKSRIRRDLKREQTKRRKALKRLKKMEEVDKLKAANPGLQIDMESALADSEPEEEEEPLHIPAKPNPVLWLRYTPEGTVWVSMGGYDAGYIYELSFFAVEPVRCTLIADGDDCEIHSYLTINDFLVFGLINGKLRINRRNPDDFTDLRNYRLFPMHDSLRGTIPRMLLSYDSEYMFSIGYDGNVFFYKWNGPKVDKPYVLPHPIPVLPDKIYDIDDPQHPSLEQEKIYAEIKRQEEAAAAHDLKILGRIGDLQVQFNDFMRDNMSLPEPLQIHDKHTLLDGRITRQISEELQAELDDVREDLAYDLEFAQVGQKKLYEFFMEKLDHIPITISGIGTNIKVESFRVEVLGEDFKKLKLEVDERLRLEAASQGIAHIVLAEEKEDSMPEPGIEKFFFGRDPNSIIPRFSRKMLRLLLRYRSRQQFEVERMYNWDKLAHQRPDPNKNHPDDERKIREAEKNLGDYKLKIGSDYEPDVTDNLTHKCLEVIECREKLFKIFHSFNDKLFILRERKKESYAFIEKQRKRLDFIHKLLPAKNHVQMMPIPEINKHEETPELNLVEHFEPSCGLNVKDIIFLERTVSELLPEPPAEEVETERFTEMEMDEMELHMNLRVNEVPSVPLPTELIEELSALPKSDEPDYLISADGKKVTPWLKEFRYRVLYDLIDEQDRIVKSVAVHVKKFDDQLKDLVLKRLDTAFNVEFMHCYMVVLNQELNILRDSETIENELLNNADEAMKTRNEMQGIINVSNRQIEESRKAVDRLNEQISSVQLKFLSTCKGHKFFDFLRRIFKKKWKPPKPPKGPDESSESSSDSSSSSEEEDDTKSVDSTDMTSIRLDETHCPPGLERPMYELAFKMRAERHDLEKALLAQMKKIELKRIEVLDLQKKMKYHEDVYAREKDTLLTFRRKRQQELNKVRVGIVLRMDQIQHFYEGDDYRDLSKAILFDANRLKELVERVDHLKNETVATRRLYRVNIVHLNRMNKDLKFMRYEITHLEEKIRESMIKKFGMVVNLDELEEEVLRKYIFDLETTAEDELKRVDREIEQKKKELQQVQQELTRETTINTDKLNILTVLTEEKQFIDEILCWQEKNYDKWYAPKTLDFDDDIERLTVVDREQKERIMCLEREICTLRMKSKPLHLDPDTSKSALVTTSELLPDDNVCPEMLNTAAYNLRLLPDPYVMENVQRVVNQFFAKHLAAHMPKDCVRRYAHKVARYLGQAGYSIEGDITPRIFDCIIENVQALIPKKYLLHMSEEEMRRMLSATMLCFHAERSEVEVEEVVSSICWEAVAALQSADKIKNQIQFVVVRVFKELIEFLSLDEFQNEATCKQLVESLNAEEFCDPRCIDMENLVTAVVEHAQENMIDNITAIPVRRLGEKLVTELKVRRKSSMNIRCSVSTLGSQQSRERLD